MFSKKVEVSKPQAQIKTIGTVADVPIKLMYGIDDKSNTSVEQRKLIWEAYGNAPRRNFTYSGVEVEYTNFKARPNELGVEFDRKKSKETRFVFLHIQVEPTIDAKDSDVAIHIATKKIVTHFNQHGAVIKKTDDITLVGDAYIEYRGYITKPKAEPQIPPTPMMHCQVPTGEVGRGAHGDLLKLTEYKKVSVSEFKRQKDIADKAMANAINKDAVADQLSGLSSTQIEKLKAMLNED